MKKDDVLKKKEERAAARTILVSLQGKTVSQMTKSQQEQFLSALGQVLNVLDETGKVKAVS